MDLPDSSFHRFDDDLAFLERHVKTVVLSWGQARLALVPAYQGRAMTSTDGRSGTSYGWINRELIASREHRPHINAFGGEDRFWLGPEGGQFSIFFKGGDPFDLEHWQTPAPIDTEPFEVVRKDPSSVDLRAAFYLENYSGFTFHIQVQRNLRMLSDARVEADLGMGIPPSVSCVAFESENRLQNVGAEAWTENTGLLSIWNLGMFNASPKANVAIPIRPGSSDDLGPEVNADYFGAVPADRLKVTRNAVLFRADARYRSKIGVSPRRALPSMGSYDPLTKSLTIVQYTLPEHARRYVNSAWQIQDQPYAGDVANSYNDGPPAAGVPQLGQFYELETSSPALALKPGEQAIHVHRTVHLSGDPEHLDAVAQMVLGVRLSEVEAAFE